MKFDILAGSHHATVDLELDGKGKFSGTIASDDFGNGKLAGIVTGDRLTGSVDLDGHSARLDAFLDDKIITGKISAGWFFTQRFTGTQVA